MNFPGIIKRARFIASCRMRLARTVNNSSGVIDLDTRAFIKTVANRLLNPVGMKLEGLKADRLERERLQVLSDSGHFQRQIFPVCYPVSAEWVESIFAACETFAEGIQRLENSTTNDVGYSVDNDYFFSPDADVLYATLRDTQPRRYVEIGSGNSTRLARQAIIDGDLSTTICCVDPEPRIEVSAYADTLHKTPVEHVDADLIRSLDVGDILFIDSSHLVRTGSDVNVLLLQIFPELKPGVLVHIHDIFLPYEYPIGWVSAGWGFNEQYLLQALLQFSQGIEVLWPGHFLQKTMEGFRQRFPLMRASDNAQSFWLRRIA